MSNKTMLQSNNTMPLLKRLIGNYLRPYFPLLWVAVFLMLIASATAAAFALLIEPIMNNIFDNKNAGFILPAALGVMACFVLRGLATYGHVLLMTKIGQSVVADIQKILFGHILSLDLAFFHARSTGELVSRNINDVNALRVSVADSITAIGRSLMTLIFLIGVMFWQNWQLSAMVFLVFPVTAYAVAKIGQKIRRVSKNIQNELADFSGLITQTFMAIRQVKAYGMESHELRRTSDVIDRVKKLTIKSIRLGNLTAPMNDTLAGITIAAVIFVGGHQVIDGTMTVGGLFSFITAFSMAYEPMKRLAKLNTTMQIGLGAAERVFEVMDTQASVENNRAGTTLKTRKPQIRFENVSFHYETPDNPALENLDLVLEAGKVTALVGPSGGGKSTIMNLLPRFYDVEAGRISVDGIDIRDVTLASLRANIAIVSQEVAVFEGTIADNIRYGTLDVDMAAVEEAAKAAAAHDFIMEMPESYDTRIGEQGVKLSGGQRQRLAIARAILRDAPILLLDEATSALDNDSERIIQETLDKIQKGRTTLVIAHRLSTVQKADKIVVINDGAKIEEGTHASLLKTAGLYGQLYNYLK